MRAIETKFVGPSYAKGSRIIVSAGDVRKIYGIGSLESEAIARNRHMDMHGEWAHQMAAILLCETMEWNDNTVLVQGEAKRGYVFIMLRNFQAIEDALHIGLATAQRFDPEFKSTKGTADVINNALRIVKELTV